MKLDRARTVMAHLAVGFAFASTTIGGDLPVPVVGGFAVAWLASAIFGARIGRGRGGLLTALTAVGLLFVMGMTAVGAVDVVIGATLLAVTMAANRLLARQSAADDGLLYLSALLMLAGGAALSSDVLYGLLFGGFALTSTAALTLSHLSREVEQSGVSSSAAERLISGKLLVGLFSMAAAALVGAVVLFVTFPRFTAGVALRAARLNQTATTGFSEQVRLGGHGTLKSDARVVLRATLSPDPGLERLDLLWRGKTFDHFDGQTWLSTAQPVRPRRQVMLGQGRHQALVRIEVLPAAATNAVFLVGAPVLATMPRRIPQDPLRPSLQFAPDELGDLHVWPAPDGTYGYDLATRFDGPPVEGRGEEYPDEIRERFLQLPERIDPRIAELAEEWTLGADDPIEQARAIERRLGRFGYTAELPDETADPVAHFLFERKEGHCEFFSTAMVLMLRTLGVPARNATGFFGGRRAAGGEYYTLRGGDAHSWAEVYVPEVGFVAFDPTPPNGRDAQANLVSSWLAEVYDRMSLAWSASVVDYSFRDQLRGVRELMQSMSSGMARLQGRSGVGAMSPLKILAALLALAISIALARALWRSGRPRGKAGGAARAPVLPPASLQVVRIYRIAVKRLQRRGVRKAPGQTAREFARQVSDAGRPEAAAVREITERYLAVRFGRAAVAKDELAKLEKRARAL